MAAGLLRDRRTAFLLLLAGLLLLVLNGWLMGRLDWRPLEQPLDTASGAVQSASFVTRSDGWYEIQLEVSRSAPAAAIEDSVAIADGPSPLDVRWRLERDGKQIAAGDARDYMFLDAGPHGFPGRMRRTLMRVPTGIDRAFWLSGGLLGHTTAARGVGRFQAEADATYVLITEAAGGLSAIADGVPRMVVRIARQTSQQHYRRVAPVGYLGLATLATGLLLWVWCLLRAPRR